MFCMEQSSRPPSLKLPLMDYIAKLLQNQDTVVRPGPSSSTSLDIGQFVPNPPEVTGVRWQGRNLSRDRKLYHKPFQILQEAKGTKAYLQLVKLELMARECITTSSLPYLQPVSQPLITSGLQGIKGKRLSDYWPQNQTLALGTSISNSC